MRYLWRALTAETLKLKRTGALLIVFAAPVTVSLVYLLQVFSQGRNAVRAQPWVSLVGNVGGLWVLLMLPLMAIAVTALWANFEHSEALWKHVFSLPLPRPSVYIAKWLLSVALVGISTFLLAACEAIVGLAIMVWLPNLGFTWPPPFAEMLRHAATLLLASVFMITVQTWVSLHFKGLYVALGFGIACSIGGVFASFSDTLNRLLPWTLPLRVQAVEGANVPETLLYSLVGGLVVGAIALVDLVRQEHY